MQCDFMYMVVCWTCLLCASASAYVSSSDICMGSQSLQHSRWGALNSYLAKNLCTDSHALCQCYPAAMFAVIAASKQQVLPLA
jgi:hypothetical protein